MSKEQTKLQQSIEAYFSACDATRERFERKNGDIAERQIPYTLYGLAHATGYAPSHIVNLCNGEQRGSKAKLFRNAVSKIAAYTLEHALLGDLTHQAALQALKDMGLLDLQSEDSGIVKIVMDEQMRRDAE